MENLDDELPKFKMVFGRLERFGVVKYRIRWQKKGRIVDTTIATIKKKRNAKVVMKAIEIFDKEQQDYIENIEKVNSENQNSIESHKRQRDDIVEEQSSFKMVLSILNYQVTKINKSLEIISSTKLDLNYIVRHFTFCSEETGKQRIEFKKPQREVVLVRTRYTGQVCQTVIHGNAIKINNQQYTKVHSILFQNFGGLPNPNPILSIKVKVPTVVYDYALSASSPAEIAVWTSDTKLNFYADYMKLLELSEAIQSVSQLFEKDENDFMMKSKLYGVRDLVSPQVFEEILSKLVS